MLSPRETFDGFSDVSPGEWERRKDKIVSEFRRLRSAADVHPAPDEDSRRKERAVRTVALAGKIRN